jgi:ABC-type multidrug transport system ATPase subunit
MSHIIETKNLTFWYSPQKKALDQLSLQVPEGAIYGFLGPNGAGKSTTMRLLTGIIPVDQEQIYLFGKPLNAQLPDVFNRVGSLVEQPTLYLHLSGIDNLRYMAKMYGLTEQGIHAALERVGLAKDGRTKAKRYSLGMKQRLAIAMALLHRPSLLLLDEPVNGLDPNGIQEVRHLLQKLNKEDGVTIFVSSHLLAEIEKMCTHIGIIHHGKLEFQGTMQELSNRFEHITLHIRMTQPQQWIDRIQTRYPGTKLLDDGRMEVSLLDPTAVGECIRTLANEGMDLQEVRPAGGLEEWFMQITSKPAQS